MNFGAVAVSVVLLFVNGGFVALEFALIASRRTKLEPLAEAGSRTAAAGLKNISELNRVLALSQLGITAASLGLGVVAEPAVAHVIEDGLAEWFSLGEGAGHAVALGIALLVVVFFHMLIGEMIPKNMAIASPERTLQIVALPVRALIVPVRPIVVALSWAAGVILKLLGVDSSMGLMTGHTPDELAGILSASSDEGLIPAADADLLAGVLELGQRPVRTIMVPRDAMVTVPRSASVAEVEAEVVASSLTRLVVVSGADHVVGYVHAKDLLDVSVGRDEKLPNSFLRTVPRIYADVPNIAALRLMREGRAHLAVVVEPPDGVGDDPLGTSAVLGGPVLGDDIGIIALDDLLQGIVGAGARASIRGGVATSEGPTGDLGA